MNKISVFNYSGEFKGLEKNLKNAAAGILRFLKKTNVRAEIYLVSARKMKAINQLFAKENRPADVLSFREPQFFPHPESKIRHLGEIFLCPSHIKKEARGDHSSYIAGYEFLIAKMLIHGMLHLLGYDHKRRDDRIKMEKMELCLSNFLSPKGALNSKIKN